MKTLTRLLAAPLLPLLAATTLAPAAHAAGDLGDLNGDGYAEVIGFTPEDRDHHGSVAKYAAFYLQYPGNTTWEHLAPMFSEGMGIPSGMDGMTSATALPDVTGDGKADVMARFGDRLYVYRGAANGTLTRAFEVGHGWGAMNQVIYAGNLNGDAKRYLLTRRNDGTLWAYLFQPGGSVADVGQVGHGWAGHRFILGPGQMVGDKKADLVSITQTGDMYCYPGIGGGRLGASTKCGHGWTGFTNVFIAGDLDKDGRYDMIGVRQATYPKLTQCDKWMIVCDPTVPAGKALSDLPLVDRNPMYWYKNAGGSSWVTQRMIGHDMFLYSFYAWSLRSAEAPPQVSDPGPGRRLRLDGPAVRNCNLTTL